MRRDRVGATPPGGASEGVGVTALLDDGPLRGTTIDVERVEGRPPKTLDVSADDGSTYRYCLGQWAQDGPRAAYTFLYSV